MANTAQLFRRQSSRDLINSRQRSIDNLELKVNRRKINEAKI